MLILKGRGVRFVLEGGRSVRVAGGMLHDPDGKDWPRCSVLVGPYDRGQKAARATLGARKYLGRPEGLLGAADVPDDRSLDSWSEIGKAERIYYVRHGEIYGGQLFQHPFKRHPTLYRQGKWARLELGRFCIMNERGFVSP